MGNLLLEELAVPASVVRSPRWELFEPPPDLSVFQAQVDPSGRDVQFDLVARLHRGERAANGRFRRNVQHVSPEARAAHASVGHANDIVDSSPEEFCRDRQMAPFRESGPAERAGVLEDHDRVLVHLKVIVVHAGAERLIPFEHQRLAAMAQQVGRSGGLFDDGAVGREVAIEDGSSSLGVERRIQGPDQVPVTDCRALHVLLQCPSADGERIAMQQWQEFLHDAREPSRVVEILHEVLARRLDVGDVRSLSGDAVEIVQR